MKPAAFAYHRPDSVAEAVQLLDEFGDDAKILAGGQSLVPMLAMRLTFFDNLIDISRLRRAEGHRASQRRPVDRGRHAGRARRCRRRGPHAVPLLTTATPHIGHFQIRTRGTLGGSIAHADPAGEYPAVALALDAEIEAISPSGRRMIPATEFFTGLWETAWNRTKCSRRSVPGVGAGVASPSGIRPPPRRFRDRRRRGRRRTRRRRPGLPLRHRSAGPGSTPSRVGGRGGRHRSPGHDLTPDDIGALAMTGWRHSRRPAGSNPTASEWAPRWSRGLDIGHREAIKA